MNWKAATITELYTIAAHEILRREKLRRKPYRNNQQKIRKAVAKW